MTLTPTGKTSLPRPIIVGISDTELTKENLDFYKDINPLGFILFKKNLKNKQQVSKFCQELRNMVGREDAPILIDQEGGAVNRFTAPEWRIPPAPLELGKFAYTDKPNAINDAAKLVFLNAQLIGYEMKEVGINVNCAPIADLLIDGAHHITSTRSFGPDPRITSILVNAMADGMASVGAQGIMKHMIGQGRANRDSHFQLPTVTEELGVLEDTDFKTFKNAQNIKWGMTAHIMYPALDSENPTSYSKKIVKYIREEIGFSGVLTSDCITMKALGDDFGEKTRKILDSGHDIVLYGSCNFKVLEAMAKNAPILSESAYNRIMESFADLGKISNIDYHETLAKFDNKLNEMTRNFKFSESENSTLIARILEERNAEGADYSSPLYKA